MITPQGVSLLIPGLNEIFIGAQLVVSQMKCVLKGSLHQIRGYQMSCPTSTLERSCGSDECRTCRMAYMIRSFAALVDRVDYADLYDVRKYVTVCFAS